MPFPSTGGPHPAPRPSSFPHICILSRPATVRLSPVGLQCSEECAPAGRRTNDAGPQPVLVIRRRSSSRSRGRVRRCVITRSTPCTRRVRKPPFERFVVVAERRTGCTQAQVVFVLLLVIIAKLQQARYFDSWLLASRRYICTFTLTSRFWANSETECG